MFSVESRVYSYTVHDPGSPHLLNCQWFGKDSQIHHVFYRVWDWEYRLELYIGLAILQDYWTFPILHFFKVVHSSLSPSLPRSPQHTLYMCTHEWERQCVFWCGVVCCILFYSKHRLGDNSVEWVLSYLCVGFSDQTWVVRVAWLGGNHLYPQSHLNWP